MLLPHLGNVVVERVYQAVEGVDFERLDCRQGIQRPPIENFIQILQRETARA